MPTRRTVIDDVEMQRRRVVGKIPQRLDRLNGWRPGQCIVHGQRGKHGTATLGAPRHHCRFEDLDERARAAFVHGDHPLIAVGKHQSAVHESNATRGHQYPTRCR